MRYVRKASRISKQQRRLGRPPKKPLPTEETLEESSPTHPDTQEVPLLPTQSLEERAPTKKPLRLDPRLISNLPEEERARIRAENPEMNEYFLMSARDKSKYFHTLNQNYRELMKLPEPPGSAPKKKTIRFKKRFEIKPFSYQ